jgi:hypothetical protein
VYPLCPRISAVLSTAAAWPLTAGAAASGAFTRGRAPDCFAALAMTAKATRYSWRFRRVSVSQVRAMDRTAQSRGKYQSACKSHGSTCTCRGTRQDPCARPCCSSNCTGSAAVYMWSRLEPRPVMPRRRPWQRYRKPAGVISLVVPPPKSRAVISYTSAERDGGPRKAYRVRRRSLVDLQPVRDCFGARAIADEFGPSRQAAFFGPAVANQALRTWLDLQLAPPFAIVESPRGLSPPGAPRTVREPLDSYGSRCSAAAMA